MSLGKAGKITLSSLTEMAFSQLGKFFLKMYEKVFTCLFLFHTKYITFLIMFCYAFCHKEYENAIKRHVDIEVLYPF